MVINQVYLIFEFVDGCELFDISMKFGKMSEDLGRYFMCQLLDTLEYIHRKGIVHLDLKLENVLLTKDAQLKLIDFGFSNGRNVENITSYLGTPSYMAPEILKLQPYNGYKSDIFSLGVILFALVVGHFPFRKAKMDDLHFHCLSVNEAPLADFEINEEYWEMTHGGSCSLEFKDLMQRMLRSDPHERITLE